jgi:hypothetical protein
MSGPLSAQDIRLARMCQNPVANFDAAGVRMRSRLGGAVAAVVLSWGVMLPAGVAQAAVDAGTGAITGRFTQPAGGAVTVNLWTTAGASAGQVKSDANGDYTFEAVPAGQYKVQFGVVSGFSTRWQWAYHQMGFSAATVFQVAADEVTRVDDSAVDPGGVQVTVTDAASGAPVENVCISQYESSPANCGAPNGVKLLTGLQDGTHRLYLTAPDGLHARASVSNVIVKYGSVTKVAVSMTPTGAITTRVVDRATGAPVAGVCVAALTLTFGFLDDQTCRYGENYSAEDGTITLGELSAGQYTLLADPEWSPYGLQWVGAQGGTGSQYRASLLDVAVGRAIAAPVVRLDPAASITGTIRDAGTGESLTNSCASVLPWKSGVSSGPSGPFCAQWGDEGRYTIGNLGPYAWPVQFSYFYDSTYAATWSGGAADRKAATLVQAGTDQPAVLDGELRNAGVGLTVTARTADGQAYTEYLAVEAYNARTGDFVKQVNSQWALDGVAEQPVRLRYVAATRYAGGWYGGANFATATNVRVQPDAPKAVQLTIQPR